MLFSSVQLLSHVWLFETSWTTAHQASLSITNSRSPPKPMATVLVMPFNHLILLSSISPSIRVFSNELALCIRWPKYWSFSFSVSASKEYSGLISFRMDWFDFLAVQGTQESSPLPQFKSFNSLALSLLYGSTLTSLHDYWKNHSFDCMNLGWQVMSLLFNTLSLSYLFLQGASGFQFHHHSEDEIIQIKFSEHS